MPYAVMNGVKTSTVESSGKSVSMWQLAVAAFRGCAPSAR